MNEPAATTSHRWATPADACRQWRLDAARNWLASGGSLLFFGSVRTGRSPEVDVVAASSRAHRVLRCTPTWSYQRQPYFALADLLSTVTDAELDLLPAGPRQVLSRALLRTDPPPARARPVTVRPAVLALLRTLARAAPLLLVVDDLQRMDEPTADVLQFVARNINGLPIQMIASEWLPRDRTPIGYQLCLPPVLALPMDPVR